MSRRSPNPVLVVLAGILAVAAEGAEKDLGPDPHRLLVRGPVVLDITRAFQGAVRKLQAPACQQLFTDFTDSEGRPLQERLGSSTPAEYLSRLVIRDGEIPKGSRRCAVAGADAFTVDGAVVFVCGQNFLRRRPSGRENVLIHEMLHTLGLREQPLGSAEITRRVEKRCGL
jgi:hypothetical protein